MIDPDHPNIPVLTEIVPTHESHTTPVKTQPTPPQPGFDAQDRAELERKLNERILTQLQGRIDCVLEHRVRGSLADILQANVDALAAQLRESLHQTLHQVVSKAIAQELNRLQINRQP